jgi:hypothetical protein
MTKERSTNGPGSASGLPGFPNSAEESRIYPERGTFNRDCDQAVIGKNIEALNRQDNLDPGRESPVDLVADENRNSNGAGRDIETGSPTSSVRQPLREKPSESSDDRYSTYLDDDGQKSDDAVITGMSEDSFPASDPPGFTSTKIGSPREK